MGLADREVAPVLESALRRAGLQAFDPDGRPRKAGGLYPVLAGLADWARRPAYETAEALGRCPAVLDYLRGRIGAGFSPARWLAGLDELKSRHLPADLQAAREKAPDLRGFPELAAGLGALGDLREALGAAGFAEGASAALGAIFAERLLELDREADARLADEAEDWGAAVRECVAASAKWGALAPADCWDLALRLFGEARAPQDKPAGAVELLGWLELLWEDAPHLAVAGMNDGCVPEAIVGDAFLPESLREKLGLKTNAARLARDAYLLQALASCRRTGRLDLLVGKASAAGDPLKPSRLLLKCDGGELPRRVDLLFRELDSTRSPLPWHRAWTLRPPKAPPVTRVAVTELRSWLRCPFRFYLEHVLDMAPVEAAKSEMDERDFGTLCHSVLEAMGRDERWRDCADVAELGQFLSEELDRRVAAKFGRSLPLSLAIQRDAARQRLRKAGEVQARERAAGWRIAEVEREISCEISGLMVRGKVDRVDVREKTGEVRVLDYKTSDQATAPAEAHLENLSRRNASAREWARWEGAERPRVWSNLQLPFYRIGLSQEYPGAALGYFNLPKAVGETRIELWGDYSPELHASASRCAAEVCAAIRRGEFWPPAEGIPEDEDRFASLFHHGAGASVQWREPT